MKKYIVIILLSIMLCGVAYADLTATLDTTWAEKKQAQAAFNARVTLQEMTNNVNEGLVELQSIKDSGEFDTLPNDLKVALNAWWQIFKDAKAAFQVNADLGELYQWTP